MIFLILFKKITSFLFIANREKHDLFKDYILSKIKKNILKNK